MDDSIKTLINGEMGTRNVSETSILFEWIYKSSVIPTQIPKEFKNWIWQNNYKVSIGLIN